MGSVGRWILRPNVRAAVPFSICFYDMIYDLLKLELVMATVVATNTAVIAFDFKCGFRKKPIQPAVQMIDGVATDLVHLEQDRNKWLAARPNLLDAARWSERHLQQWEIRTPALYKERSWLSKAREEQ